MYFKNVLHHSSTVSATADKINVRFCHWVNIRRLYRLKFGRIYLANKAGWTWSFDTIIQGQFSFSLSAIREESIWKLYVTLPSVNTSQNTRLGQRAMWQRGITIGLCITTNIFCNKINRWIIHKNYQKQENKIFRPSKIQTWTYFFIFYFIYVTLEF